MKKLFTLVLIFSQLGCGYKLGFADRRLPEGYKQLAIPVFKNKTHETGVEVYFTNAIIQQFALSKIARVVPKKKAPIVLEGQITEIKYESEAQATLSSDSPTPNLPKGAVLTTKYRIYIFAKLRLIRVLDNKVIWQSPFKSEKDYSAPLLERENINSANALYNHSARQREIQLMAESMMTEVHDRLSESF